MKKEVNKLFMSELSKDNKLIADHLMDEIFSYPHLTNYLNLDRPIKRNGKDGQLESVCEPGERTPVEDENALHLVLKNGHIRVLQYLMKTKNIKYALRAKNHCGNTPMHSLALNIYSSRDEFDQIFRILTPNAQDSQEGFNNSAFKQSFGPGLENSPQKSQLLLQQAGNHPDNNKPPPLYLKNDSQKTPYTLVLERIRNKNPFDPNLDEIRQVVKRFKH